MGADLWHEPVGIELVEQRTPVVGTLKTPAAA